MVVLWTDGETEHTDRRKWDRYSPDGETSVTLAAGGRAFGCELLDLSLGGARLRIDADLPDDRDVVLQHRVAGLFFASQTWRRGNELGVRFRVASQTREHALQCATVLLYGDADEFPGASPTRRVEDARAAG
ncbi:MAG: PilZ domain-containing protein [Geminicoccales bacterium]